MEKIVCKSVSTNMATVQVFEFTSDELKET
jgi:hypothetical protein